MRTRGFGRSCRGVDPVRLERQVDRLRQGRFLEPHDLGVAHPQEFFQFRGGVAGDDGVMAEVLENLVAAVGGEVLGNQHEVEPPLGARDIVPTDQENARAHGEPEQGLRRGHGLIFCHDPIVPPWAAGCVLPHAGRRLGSKCRAESGTIGT